MLERTINRLKRTSGWKLLWICVISSMIFSAAIVSLISLWFQGRIAPYYLVTGIVTALLLSLVVTFVLSVLIKALRQAEQRTADLMANSAVAAFVINPEHKVVFWNRACEELTGIPAADMIGTDNQWKAFYARRRQTLADVIVDGNVGDLPGLYGTVARSILIENGLRTEGWYKNLNGKDRYIIFDAAPVNDGKGELSLVIETLHDVTSHKRMEEEFAKSEAQLRTIINTEPECVKLVAADDTLLEMNPAGLAMIEASSPEEAMGKSIMPLIAPEYRPAMKALTEKVFQGESGALEFELVGLKGAHRWLETRAVPLRNARGDIYALLGVTRDITKHKKWEKTLQEQLQFLQLLIDTIPMPVFYKDVHGVYLGYNKAFEEFLGIPKGKLIGKTVYDVAPKELADTYFRRDKELFDHPGVQVYEFTVKHADGTYHDVIFNKATYSDMQGNVAGLLGVMQDISERKRMEETLKQTNETLQAMIHASPLAIVSFDANGNVGMWNPAAERMFGWSEQEARGRFNPLVLEDQKEEFFDLLKRVLQGESLAELELRRHRKDGSLIDVSVSSAPIRNGKNDITGIMSLISDITERKRAEEIIQRNYDVQAVINWVLNISLKDVSLDGTLKQTLDLLLFIPWLSFAARGSIFLVEDDPDKLVMKAQRGLEDRIREECRIVPFGKCLCGRAAARGEVQFADGLDDRHEVVHEGIAPHGHYCVPIKYERKVIGVINIYLKEGHQRDDKEIEFLNAVASALVGIIQRKRIEEDRRNLILELQDAVRKISRSQKEWLETFDSITDMISIHDDTFTIIKANKAFAHHYGREPQDIVNKQCSEISRDLIAECPSEASLRENRVVTREITDPKTGRVFMASTYPFSFPGSDSRGTIRIARDITEEREREMRLIMSERLAALGQMASGIAHEINNPLTAIRGCAEALLTRVQKDRYDPVLFDNYLKIIEEEIGRCKNITTGMLSVVRKASYVHKDVDIHEGLDKTIDIIGFQGRLKEVSVAKHYKEGMPTVQGNEGELRQVFLAVITNAVDAMEENGTLTIETGTEGDAVYIKIGDTGPGIPAADIGRIFGPFFTTKSERGGTGLGLSIANKIILNHKGRIDVASEEGKGATFTIMLPRFAGS